MTKKPTPPEASAESADGIIVQQRQGCVWVTLPDAINMDTHMRIEKKVDAMLHGKPARMVIDLAETRNMYSAGFGMIVRVKRVMAEYDGKLYVVNVNPKVMEAMQFTGIHKILSVYEQGATLDFLE
jgi:anti-anti-sigma factor